MEVNEQKNEFAPLEQNEPIFCKINYNSKGITKEKINQENSDKINRLKEIGACSYTTLKSVFNKYLYLPDGADTALALWTIFTYGYKDFEFAPRLAILSPEPRCGKSTVLRVLECLVNEPMNASNISAAAIFRSINGGEVTLLLDEVDTFINSKNNKEMVGVLNAGHRKNGIVMRMGGVNYTAIQRFNCFCPVALAGIGKIPEALKDRSIILSLKRKRPEDKIECLRVVKFEKETESLRKGCKLFMKFATEQILDIKIPTQPFLSDRGNDNWEGLFQIAKFISDEIYDEAIKASQKLSKNAFDDEMSIRCQLLTDIKYIFETKGVTDIESIELCAELQKIEESPWFYYENKGLTAYDLANLLRFFNVKSRQMKKDGINKKRYVLKDFADAFERYLPKEGDDTSTSEDKNPDKIDKVER